jgi:hypothetical protein
MRLLTAIVLSVAALGALAAPRSPATGKGNVTPCSVRGTVAQLEVRCPSATLPQLLTALRGATGLRADYAEEIATARVSVVLRRSTLTHALEAALAGFNFAVWRDEQSPYATHVSVLGMRHGTDREQLALDYTPTTYAETIAAAGAAAPVAPPQRTAETNERVPSSGGVIPAAASGLAEPAPSQRSPAAVPRASAEPLQAARPSAILLAPPATGRTPLMPQRADGAVLRPVSGNGQ